MYKIVFIVAVLAFTIQCASSTPAVEKQAQQAEGNSLLQQNDKNENSIPASNTTIIPSTTTTTTTTANSSSTQEPSSGALSSEISLLLVQITSLALIAKHIML